uniref:Uncharacterized protein n=1 Tax=Mimivirus LCMiAC01 TaxID=2506608 RepID=A0A481YZQ0_9VIRU|nr:MAG: hypothetical protein LCMiAC01_03660 [Mimivirus LCMiAC01]
MSNKIEIYSEKQSDMYRFIHFTKDKLYYPTKDELYYPTKDELYYPTKNELTMMSLKDLDKVFLKLKKKYYEHKMKYVVEGLNRKFP